MQNFMELNMEEFYGKIKSFSSQSCNFVVWGLENSFWSFLPKRLIKPQVQNPDFVLYIYIYIYMVFILS